MLYTCVGLFTCILLEKLTVIAKHGSAWLADFHNNVVAVLAGASVDIMTGSGRCSLLCDCVYAEQ